MKSWLWISGSLLLAFSVAVADAQCSGIAGSIALLRPVTGVPFSADYIHVFEPINRDGTRSRFKAHGQSLP